MPPSILSDNLVTSNMMIDGIEIAFAYNHVFVFKRFLVRHPFGAESLVLDSQKIPHSGVFEHCCRRPKIQVFMGVLDLHMNDGSVMF